MRIFNHIAGALSLLIVALFPQATIAETAESSAKLLKVQGDVMVNDGTRFVKAVSGAELKPGAKIVTTKDSTATLVYQNGCIKHVQSNSMLTVGSAAECVAMAGNERIYTAEAIGDAAASAASPAQYALGKGLGVALVAAVAIGFSTSGGGSNNNMNNASPQ